MNTVDIMEKWLMLLGVIFFGIVLFAMLAVLFLEQNSVFRRNWTKWQARRTQRKQLQKIRGYIRSLAWPGCAQHSGMDIETWETFWNSMPEEARQELIRAGEESHPEKT